MNMILTLLISLCLYTCSTSYIAAKTVPSSPVDSLPTPSLTNNLGGRFGDQLIEYMQIKWLSLKYNIPIVLRPSPLLTSLVLYDHETIAPVQLRYWQVANEPLVSLSQLENPRQDTIYVVTMHPENEQEYRDTASAMPRFDIDWKDPVFHNLIKAMVRPKQALPSLKLPKDRVSVAVHIRRGGGYRYDTLEEMNFVPLKFPPVQWYADQLKELRNLLGSVPLYVHLFSDDPDPADLCRTIKKLWLNSGDVSFGYRQKGNQYNLNVMEDLFTMTQFDCLVRSMSSYSLTASKIGDFFIEIFPISYERRGRAAFINQAQIDILRPLEELYKKIN